MRVTKKNILLAKKHGWYDGRVSCPAISNAAPYKPRPKGEEKYQEMQLALAYEEGFYEGEGKNHYDRNPYATKNPIGQNEIAADFAQRGIKK